MTQRVGFTRCAWFCAMDSNFQVICQPPLSGRLAEVWQAVHKVSPHALPGDQGVQLTGTTWSWPTGVIS